MDFDRGRVESAGAALSGIAVTIISSLTTLPRMSREAAGPAFGQRLGVIGEQCGHRTGADSLGENRVDAGKLLVQIG